MDALRVSDKGCYLVDTAGRPVFLLAHAAFRRMRRLRCDDMAMYLRMRCEQAFNAVALVAVGGDVDLEEGASDTYDHPAFAVLHGRIWALQSISLLPLTAGLQPLAELHG